MGAPYTSVIVDNYNLNPPPDDGSQVVANRIDWSKQKEKLGDPLKDAIEEINTNVGAAFGKVIGGGGVTSTAISYGISASDQGKLVKATAAGITLTTPDATVVTSPFVCAVNNNSSGAITLDGNGSQTIDGQASITLGAGQGCFLFTDGTNWFTAGLGGILAGNQMGYGQIINGTIAESNGSNAVTFALKTLAGNDPSVTDPVIIAFRNSTLATGNYVYRSVTAALTLVIPSTATMGASNGVAFRLWLELFDDAGTIRLGAINCLSGTNIYPLGQLPRVSSTTVSTGADSAHVFYTNTGVSSKPYVVLGYATYESGLATAGTWNVSPTSLELYGPGVPLPGHLIQTQATFTGAYASGNTALPHDDTIPQNTEGTQFMTQAITPTSAANLLEVDWKVNFAAAAAAAVTSALFQDSTANALAATPVASTGTTSMSVLTGLWALIAGTTSSTTFKIRVGDVSSDQINFNGTSGGRSLGGVNNSYLRVTERMA